MWTWSFFDRSVVKFLLSDRQDTVHKELLFKSNSLYFCFVNNILFSGHQRQRSNDEWRTDWKNQAKPQQPGADNSSRVESDTSRGGQREKCGWDFNGTSRKLKNWIPGGKYLIVILRLYLMFGRFCFFPLLLKRSSSYRSEKVVTRGISSL